MRQKAREETQSRDREGAVSSPAASVGTRNVGTSEWRAHSCVPCRHSWRHVLPRTILSVLTEPPPSGGMTRRGRHNPPGRRKWFSPSQGRQASSFERISRRGPEGPKKNPRGWAVAFLVGLRSVPSRSRQECRLGKLRACATTLPATTLPATILPPLADSLLAGAVLAGTLWSAGGPRFRRAVVPVPRPRRRGGASG